jgi:hypothetical protein
MTKKKNMKSKNNKKNNKTTKTRTRERDFKNLKIQRLKYRLYLVEHDLMVK